METLKVGDIRKFNQNNWIFTVTAVGETKVLIRKHHDNHEDTYMIDHVLRSSTPYQEPKPVRRLTAWEYRNNGEVVFSLSDGINHSGYYRKLSDEELKELIKGVIGE